MQLFVEALADRVLVCDGAMGTMLYAKGIFVNKSFDALNLAEPDLVGERAPRRTCARAPTCSKPTPSVPTG